MGTPLLRRSGRPDRQPLSLVAVDDALQPAYRRIPPDPDVVRMAARLAAKGVPEWWPGETSSGWTPTAQRADIRCAS
jgi:hypothetical protein